MDGTYRAGRWENDMELFSNNQNDGRALYLALRVIPVALALALVAEWVL